MQYRELGGGFNYFLFLPGSLGKWSNLTTAICFKWVGSTIQPPTNEKDGRFPGRSWPCHQCLKRRGPPVFSETESRWVSSQHESTKNEAEKIRRSLPSSSLCSNRQVEPILRLDEGFPVWPLHPASEKFQFVDPSTFLSVGNLKPWNFSTPEGLKPSKLGQGLPVEVAMSIVPARMFAPQQWWLPMTIPWSLMVPWIHDLSELSSY